MPCVYTYTHNSRTHRYICFAAQHLQRAPTSGSMLPQTGNWPLQPQPGAGIQNNQTLQACQQKLRLQSLQMERERLKQRQQEIMRQVSSVNVCPILCISIQFDLFDYFNS